MAPSGWLWAIMVVAGITSQHRVRTPDGRGLGVAWMLVAAASAPTANLRRRSSATAFHGVALECRRRPPGPHAVDRSGHHRRRPVVAPRTFRGDQPGVEPFEHLPIERRAAARRRRTGSPCRAQRAHTGRGGPISAAELRRAARTTHRHRGDEPDDHDVDQPTTGPRIPRPSTSPRSGPSCSASGTISATWHVMGRHGGRASPR